MPPAKSKYKEGDSVLCSQGRLMYEAKIQGVRKLDGIFQYDIHYKGWNKTWDEWVTDERLLECTPENLERARLMEKEVQASKGKKTSSSSSIDSKPQPGEKRSLDHSPVSAGENKKTKGEELSVPGLSRVRQRSPRSRSHDSSTSSKSSKSTNGKSEVKAASRLTRQPSTSSTAAEATTVESEVPASLQSDSSSASEAQGGQKPTKTKSASQLPSKTAKQAASQGKSDKKEKSRKKSCTGSKVEASKAATIVSKPPVANTKTDKSSKPAARPSSAASRPLPATSKPAAGKSRQATNSGPRVESTTAANSRTPATAKTGSKTNKKQQDVKPPAVPRHLFGEGVKIELPDNLKSVLVDDFDFMTRQRKLTMLPSRYTVQHLVNAYYESKKSFERRPNVEALLGTEEICRGLKDYFNATLGCQLLYKFERVQYADVLKEHPGTSMCQIYGPVHLLRLLTKLGPILTASDMDQDSLKKLVAHMEDFVVYMSKHKETLFQLEDYGTAPPEYHRRAL